MKKKRPNTYFGLTDTASGALTLQNYLLILILFIFCKHYFYYYVLYYYHYVIIIEI